MPEDAFSHGAAHRNYRNRPNYRKCPYKRTVKQFRSLQITASVLFVYFIKKIRKKNRIIIIKSFSDIFYSVSLIGGYIFYHKWVFPDLTSGFCKSVGFKPVCSATGTTPDRWQSWTKIKSMNAGRFDNNVFNCQKRLFGSRKRLIRVRRLSFFGSRKRKILNVKWSAFADPLPFATAAYPVKETS